MDCDLRKSVMHRVFGLRNFYGLVNALVGDEDLPEIWWQEPVSGLRVATSGPVPPNPAELLGSKRFAHLLGRAREEFDYVLIDSPPVGPVSDPAILATQGDGVLLVFDSQRTRKDSLREAVRDLESVGIKVLGTVMNNVKTPKGSYYEYGYGHRT
jgi:capsular exopolysaccharide synthesis family protein